MWTLATLKHGKKKTSAVVYTPLNQASNVSSVVEQKILQIPPYEDSGVKYQGKYKTQQSQDTYELRTQVTRFISFGVGNTGGVFDFTFARARSDLKFYATKAIIHYYGINSWGLTINWIISDYKAGAYTPKFAIWPTSAADNLVLDFTDSPRLFEGTDFGLNITAGIPLAGFVVISLFGWEQQQ